MGPVSGAAVARLAADYRETLRDPIPGLSAAPLEDNLFEWHCNFSCSYDSGKTVTLHCILDFPEDFPARSPQCEFLPTFHFSGGATQRGKRGGTKVCLSIFSDFAQIHSEWANEKGTGWSPSYSAQTVLLNLVSFLDEINGGGSGRGYYGHGSSDMAQNAHAAKGFTCAGCGHSHDQPWPEMPSEEVAVAVTASKSNTDSEKDMPLADEALLGVERASALTCYVTKRNYLQPMGDDVDGDAASRDVFGFGVSIGGSKFTKQLTSPCEFMTLAGYEALHEAAVASRGRVESVMREELHGFLPLVMDADHSARPGFCQAFERSISDIVAQCTAGGGTAGHGGGGHQRGGRGGGRNHNNGRVASASAASPRQFKPDDVLYVLPKLLNSSVVAYMNGDQHTSERAMWGYFQLHKTFAWAVGQQYREALLPRVHEAVDGFVTREATRDKKVTPNMGEWLALLLVAQDRPFAGDLAQAYLEETQLRNVMWNLRADGGLANNLTAADRLARTFAVTEVSRNLLAFQLVFLALATTGATGADAAGKREEEVAAEHLHGFPTDDQTERLRSSVKQIRTETSDYAQWYERIGVEYAGDTATAEMLWGCVTRAATLDGYNDNRRGGNGGGNRRGGGGGDGGGRRGNNRGNGGRGRGRGGGGGNNRNNNRW